MDDLFSIIELVFTNYFIVALIIIIINVLLIIAIFTIAGNSTAIRKEQEKQTEILLRQEKLLAEIAGYRTENDKSTIDQIYCK